MGWGWTRREHGAERAGCTRRAPRPSVREQTSSCLNNSQHKKLFDVFLNLFLPCHPSRELTGFLWLPLFAVTLNIGFVRPDSPILGGREQLEQAQATRSHQHPKCTQSPQNPGDIQGEGIPMGKKSYGEKELKSTGCEIRAGKSRKAKT